MRVTNSFLKKTGLIILLIPSGLLLLFTVGEVIGGDMSGLLHLLQLLPLILVAVLAWKKPFIGGALLFSLGIILGILYAFTVKFPIESIFMTEFILFFPPIMSGLLFLLSTHQEDEKI